MPVITSVHWENRILHKQQFLQARSSIKSFQDMIVESGYKLWIRRPIFQIINRIVSWVYP